MLSHNTLEVYYQTIFALAQHHKYSIAEIEDMIPFERDIYYMMLIEHIKEVEEKRKKNVH